MIYFVRVKKQFQTLRTHQLVHLSDKLSKLLSCDADGCSFTTKYASHLALHKKIHRVNTWLGLPGLKIGLPGLTGLPGFLGIPGLPDLMF
jgi:hypothetical protein